MQGVQRTIVVSAAVAAILAGCASSDKSTSSLADHWSQARFGAPPEAGLDAGASLAAANARILADRPAVETNEVATVATARAPLYAQPSTESRLLGTVKQGVEVSVRAKVLWYRLPEEWYGSRRGEQDGMLPSWARVEVAGRSGYMPWRCLDETDRVAGRPPEKVERGALLIDGTNLESSRKNFSEKKTKDEKRRLARMTKGMASAEVIAAADPDFETLDAFILAANPRALPSREASAGIEIDFESPTAAEEFFVGRLQAARIIAAQPVFEHDEPISEYVREVGMRVAANSSVPRPYSEWAWIVVVDPSERNAFALPGGFVFITTGMLDFLANEDELAAVLAHEVAHVEQGHPMHAVYRGIVGDETNDKIDSGAETAKSAAGWLSALGVEGADDVKSGIETAQEVDEAFGIRAAVFAEVMKGYDQSAETEADGRGIALTAAAGYDPRSMAILINRMVRQGMAGPESHYSPKREPQAIRLTEVFLESRGESPDLSPQASPRSATRHRRAVAEAMAGLASESRDPDA